MKNTKVSENITLVHALSCIEERLPLYVNEPWSLAADMRDLETMKRLAFSDYFKKIKVHLSPFSSFARRTWILTKPLED
jgi:hypothetical protein